MPTSIREQSYSDIFLVIMETFGANLADFFFKRKLNVVQIDQDDELATIVRKMGDNKIVFPFFAVKFGSVEDDTGSYNPFLMRMQGITRRTTNDRNVAAPSIQFKFLPAKINVSLKFVGNDVKDKYLFVQRWRDAAKMHYLDFIITPDSGGGDIRIKVDCDSTVQFAEPSASSELGNQYTMEVTASLHGYTGSIITVQPITKWNVRTYVIEGTEAVLDKIRTFELKDGNIMYDGQIVSGPRKMI
jgi:hypothetical protein